MTTVFNTDGKPGYVYNEADDTWYQIAGKTDISGTFEWGGLHTFLSSVTTVDNLVGKKGINNFLNPAARDAAIISPSAGTVCLIRQDSVGNIINELQVYIDNTWITVLPSPAGQAGKYLKSDGTITIWEATPDAMPQIFLVMGA